MKVKHKDILVLSEYVNCKSYVECECTVCGHLFKSIPNNLLQGKGCVVCALRKLSDKYRKTTQQFIFDLKKVNPNITVCGEYLTARKKIACLCKKCNHSWTVTPTNLLTGYGCPNCDAIRKRLYPPKTTQFDFEQRLQEIDPNIIVIGEYVNSHTKIKTLCKKCGHIWATSPTHLSAGTGCPNCKLSAGEQRIFNFLSDHKIMFQQQKKFDDLFGLGGGKLSYDFYLPLHNLLIEFQGQYHDGTVQYQTKKQFERQVKHDGLKRKYAKDNGYNLLEIWYTDLKRINKILAEQLLHSKLQNPLTTTAS